MRCSIILLNLYKIWCNQSSRLVQHRGLPHAARGSCTKKYTHNSNGCIPLLKMLAYRVLSFPVKLISTPTQQQANLLGSRQKHEKKNMIHLCRLSQSSAKYAKVCTSWQFPAGSIPKFYRASPPRKATKRSTISFFLPTGKPCSLHSCRSSWKMPQTNWMSLDVLFWGAHQLGV